MPGDDLVSQNNKEFDDGSIFNNELDHIMVEIDSLLDKEFSPNLLTKTTTESAQADTGTQFEQLQNALFPETFQSALNPRLARHQAQFEIFRTKLEDLFEDDEAGERYIDHVVDEHDRFIENMLSSPDSSDEMIKIRLYEFGENADALLIKYIVLYLLQHISDDQEERSVYLQHLFEQRYFDRFADTFRGDATYPSLYEFCIDQARRSLNLFSAGFFEGKKGTETYRKRAFLYDSVIEAMERDTRCASLQSTHRDASEMEVMCKALFDGSVRLAYLLEQEDGTKSQLAYAEQLRSIMDVLLQLQSVSLRTQCVEEFIDNVRHSLIARASEHLIHRLLPDHSDAWQSGTSTRGLYKDLVKKRNYINHEFVSIRGLPMKMNSINDFLRYHLTNPVTKSQKGVCEIIQYTLDLIQDTCAVSLSEKVPVAPGIS